MNLRFMLLAATALVAANSYAQPAPTPPVAPPLPQPGAAEPIMQAKPSGIPSAPDGGKKEQKWASALATAPATTFRSTPPKARG